MFPHSIIPTGNEFISLDNINTKDASISNLTFLHMQSKGLLDLRGDSLFEIEITINDKKIDNSLLSWSLISYWIPKATLETEDYKIEITILTPIEQRGFVYNLLLQNKTDSNLSATVNFKGSLESLYHCVNEEKFFKGDYEVIESSWNNGPVFYISKGFPVVSLAPVVNHPISWNYNNELPINYSSNCNVLIKSKSKENISCFWGIGYEEVASVTAAKEMRRMTYKALLNETVDYLNERTIKTNNEDYNTLLNRNLLYTLFYSTGLTLDTEERVIVTSRSPKYYVSAAYWDRDSLLWAFPAIVNVDKDVAKEMIEYVATRQKRNIGIHSRFIDGTVLEPGFELDELCCFIIALEYYINITDDRAILENPSVVDLIRRILKILETKKSEKLNLYETFLQPTDDMRVYPYLTYNNAMVYKMFKILEDWDFDGKKQKYQAEKEEVKTAIFKHCIKTVNGVKQFIWSINETGDYDIYDEPPGSLILLPKFAIVEKTDKIYVNTVNVIKNKDYEYSFDGYPFGAIGCPHAPHPWILSLANNLRIFHDDDSLNKLLKAKMDNGIACESIDENSGISTTGDAFATCAGYLSFTLLGEIEKFL